jgi:5-methylcytosine-specific restriction endonuclease McrA
MSTMRVALIANRIIGNIGPEKAALDGCSVVSQPTKLPLSRVALSCTYQGGAIGMVSLQISSQGYLVRSRKTGGHHIDEKVHRLVWQAHYGSIPPGYDVHHLDGNRLNNDIGNLRCLSHGDHTRQHRTPANEKIERQCSICGDIKPLSDFPQCGKGFRRRRCKVCHAARYRGLSPVWDRRYFASMGGR